MDVTGVITKILPIEQGVSKASGKEWQKLSFILETDEQYNNVYCFEVFGAEKVEDFTQRYNVGNTVKVEFNVNTNEWNGKYFTSLSMWLMEPVGQQSAPPNDAPPAGKEQDNLPF